MSFKIFSVVVLLLIDNVVSERSAISHLNNGIINGTVYFTEVEEGVRVHGIITGLAAGEYGFHVHELGDTSTCIAAGAHFNPDGHTHGGRNHTTRHVGDFGNVMFVANDSETPIATVNFIDTWVTLRGTNNIVGRTLVLHEQRDDLGLGNHPDSLTTGNAGARVACGVIGVYGDLEAWTSSASSPSISGLIVFSTVTYLFFRN